MLHFADYKTVVFDCDGVVLDSNQLKIQAYYDTAIIFGANPAQAQALVDYHVLLGGISRYTKFDYFIREILQQPFSEAAMQKLLRDFNSEVERLLSTCTIAPELAQLRDISKANWMILSGGDQQELRTIFKLREIDHYFDAGIYGSPDNKDVVLAREIDSGTIRFPALFLGDSRYDHQAATRAGLDFIFLNGWTDFIGWQDYCQKEKITVLPNMRPLLSQPRV
jgi:phosphoglycolate phosphatase-like HAD superfamily hydrolase